MTARAAAAPAGLAGGLRTPRPCASGAMRRPCPLRPRSACRLPAPPHPPCNPCPKSRPCASVHRPRGDAGACRARGPGRGRHRGHQSHRRCRAVLPSLPSNAGRPAPRFSPRCGSALPPCRLLYSRTLAPPRPRLSTSGTGLPPPASRANAPRLRPRTAASAAAVAATVAGYPCPCAPPLTEHAARAAPGHTRAPAPAPMRRIVAGTAAPPGGARARDGAPCRTVAAPAGLSPLPPRRSVPAAARGNRRLAGGPGFLPRPCRAQLFAARVLGFTAQPCPTGRCPS